MIHRVRMKIEGKWSSGCRGSSVNEIDGKVRWMDGWMHRGNAGKRKECKVDM
jgi:hypothetical protein